MAKIKLPNECTWYQNPFSFCYDFDYLLYNNKQQLPSIEYSLYFIHMVLFTSHNNPLDTLIFPTLQRENWGSKNFKCIVLATYERKKLVLYHCKSLPLWLPQTVSMKSVLKYLWRTALLFGVFGIWKTKSEFLFQKTKTVNRALAVTGTKPAWAQWMPMWIILVGSLLWQSGCEPAAHHLEIL